MKQILQFTWRNWLIAAHDVLANIAAVLLSFFLRFEGTDLDARLALLLKVLPYFAVFSFFVCSAFRLTTTKWRFISLPDLMNIVRVATVLAVALLILDYIFLAPNVYGTFFLGKTTIVLYWFVEIFALSGARLVYRYFRYTRTRNQARVVDAAPAILIGRAADAEVLLRAIENGAVRHLWPVGILSPSRADRGQAIRGVPVLGGLDDLGDVVADFARRAKPMDRVVMLPSAFEAEAHPESILIHSRKLGLTVSRLPSLEGSEETPRLAPVAVEDLLLRPSVKIDYGRLEALVKGKSIAVTGGGGSIGSEICDRVVAFGAARLLIIEHAEPALFAVMEAVGAGEGGVFQRQRDVAGDAAPGEQGEILEDVGEGVEAVRPGGAVLRHLAA